MSFNLTQSLPSHDSLKTYTREDMIYVCSNNNTPVVKVSRHRSSKIISSRNATTCSRSDNYNAHHISTVSFRCRYKLFGLDLLITIIKLVMTCVNGTVVNYKCINRSRVPLLCMLHVTRAVAIGKYVKCNMCGFRFRYAYCISR